MDVKYYALLGIGGLGALYLIQKARGNDIPPEPEPWPEPEPEPEPWKYAIDMSLPYSYIKGVDGDPLRVWQYVSPDWYVYNHGMPDISNMTVTPEQWAIISKEEEPEPVPEPPPLICNYTNSAGMVSEAMYHKQLADRIAGIIDVDMSVRLTNAFVDRAPIPECVR